MKKSKAVRPKHPLSNLITERVLLSSPWHVTVGILDEITDGYFVVSDAFRLHADKPDKRRNFTKKVCRAETNFEPTHKLLRLAVPSIHTIFRVDSVDWQSLEKFENEINSV